MWLALFSASATLTVCIVLIRRTHDLKRTVQAQMANASTDVKQAVQIMLDRSVGHRLFYQGTAKGFSSLQVAYREAQDSYANCQQLLTQIEAASRAEKTRDVLNLSRMLRQLAHSLRCYCDETAKSIELVEQRLMEGVEGASIARLERFNPGVPLDHRTMTSMNYGTHVEAMLSPIVIKPDGKVLHKAKVFCR